MCRSFRDDCRDKMPRVCELIDLIEDRSAPAAYFKNFEKNFRVEEQFRQAWLAREAHLGKLNREAWEFLRDEMRPYLTRRDSKRGWEQLISVMNQARAYSYLQAIGCSTPRFIPRDSRKKTPDLEVDRDGGKVLCEVKTINISDFEVSARKSGNSRMISDRLSCGFLNKLISDLEGAKKQMEAYDNHCSARRMVFVIINFDDLLAEYKNEYYRQIDALLAKDPVDGIEIVFYNQITAFHSQLAMIHAIVVNE